MNLVLYPVPILKSTTEQWPSPEAVAHHKAAMFKLSKLKLIESVDNGRKVRLNGNFRCCLLKVILGGSSKDTMFVGVGGRGDGDGGHKLSERPPSAERVEQHAKHRWETILNILVGIGDNKVIGNNPQNRATSALLVQVGLIRMDDGGRPVIAAFRTSSRFIKCLAVNRHCVAEHCPNPFTLRHCTVYWEESLKDVHRIGTRILLRILLYYNEYVRFFSKGTLSITEITSRQQTFALKSPAGTEFRVAVPVLITSVDGVKGRLYVRQTGIHKVV